MFVGNLIPRASLFMALSLLALLSVGLYRADQRTSFSETFVRLITAFVLAALTHMTFFYLVPGMITGRGVLGLSLILGIVAISVIRTAFHFLVSSERSKKNILVYGAGDSAASLASFCSSLGRPSFRIAGYVATLGDNHRNSRQCTPAISRRDSLFELARKERVEEIVVAMDDRRKGFPARDLLKCRLHGIRVCEALTFIERETGRIDVTSLHPSWLIFGQGFRQSSAHRMLKRVIDIVWSAGLLVIIFPVLTVAVIAILVESGGRGSVIYRQLRVGLNGKPFEIYKLRSMIPEAESDGQARWAATNDPRTTRVGALLRRLKIDELPQLVNILRGEMSFVGPRPERPEFVAKLEKQLPFYSERHCVKPGLTGWAQLCYPYGASVEDARQKLQYELYYLKNHSPLFDLLILIETLSVIIWGRTHRLDTVSQRSITVTSGREISDRAA